MHPPAPVPPAVWIQPIVRDRNGTLRFRANPLVRYLLDCGSLHLTELNFVAEGCAPNPEECARSATRPEMIEQAQRAKAGLAETTVEDWEQLHHLTVVAPNPIVTYVLDRGGIGVRELVAACRDAGRSDVLSDEGSAHGLCDNIRIAALHQVSRKRREPNITKTTGDDWDLFHMLIGYSVSGLPYRNEETYRHCQELARRMTAATAAEQSGGA